MKTHQTKTSLLSLIIQKERARKREKERYKTQMARGGGRSPRLSPELSVFSNVLPILRPSSCPSVVAIFVQSGRAGHPRVFLLQIRPHVGGGALASLVTLVLKLFVFLYPPPYQGSRKNVNHGSCLFGGGGAVL